jgi:hypothetical protein
MHKHLIMWFSFKLQKKRNKISFHVIIYTHKNNEFGSIPSSVYNDTHNSIAYLSWGVWLVPMHCGPSQTYVLSLLISLFHILTSWVFPDALTASSNWNLPCLAVSDSSSKMLSTILIPTQHTHRYIYETKLYT